MMQDLILLPHKHRYLMLLYGPHEFQYSRKSAYIQFQTFSCCSFIQNEMHSFPVNLSVNIHSKSLYYFECFVYSDPCTFNTSILAAVVWQLHCREYGHTNDGIQLTYLHLTHLDRHILQYKANTSILLEMKLENKEPLVIIGSHLK